MQQQRLHVEQVGAGPRVALVHGFTQTGRSWATVRDALVDHFTVVTVDAPGHGGSAEVGADLDEGALLLGDAAGAAAYAGYSMGGRLALHLALARPHLVRSLVLVGATGGIEDEDERTRRRMADDALATRIEQDGVESFVTEWLRNPLFATLPAGAAGADDRLRNSAAGLASSLRLAGTGTQRPLWPRLGALTMPVLVVAGELDTKFRAIGERMVEEIGANARLRLVRGAGHACHLERPKEFVAIMRPFLLGD